MEELKENEVVESTTTNSLAIPQMNSLNVNLFGESKTKRITNLDLTDEENADMVLNAQTEADFKLNEEIGKEIEVIGCVLTETPVESVNEETGEVVTRRKHSMCLFDKEGLSHVTGSNSCYMSFMQIIALKGMPTREKPLTLIPIKAPAQTQGHEYLRLKIKSSK